MSAPVIAVHGAGAFGTALAAVIARSTDRAVPLICRTDVAATRIGETGRNERRLPGIDLPPGIVPTADAGVLADANIVLLAVPSSAQAEAARMIAPILAPGADLVICAKGFDRETGGYLSETVASAAPNAHVSVLSGPGFAADMARDLPTAMTLAAADHTTAERVSAALSGPSFRLYASDDPAGVQIGGALKNVLAIAAGIVDGAGLGESARAALIARGLAELSRLVIARGGRATTATGLSGLGDLVLTATSRQSRNLRFGIALGEGARPDDLLGDGLTLVEGALAAPAAARMAQELSVAMPITDAVSLIITGALTVEGALAALMSRPLTRETD